MTRMRAKHSGARKAAGQGKLSSSISQARGLASREPGMSPSHPVLMLWMSRWWILPVCGAVFAVALCMVFAHTLGFPLDDSWIHQDFARTLALTGRFAYLPGRSGAGSTSPLWVLLLLPPQLIFHGQPPLWLVMAWPVLLGCAALAGTGVFAGAATRALARHAGVTARVTDLASVVVALGVVTEWHLVWAAASGMETVLFALAVLALFYLAGRSVHPVALGIVTALAYAIRPEAVLAGGVVVGGSLWAAVYSQLAGRFVLSPAARRALRGWALNWLVPYGVSCLVGCLPDIAINLVASGHLLPSTFYAKSSYYATANYLVAAGSDAVGLAVELVGSSPVVLLGLALSYSQWLLSRREKTTINEVLVAKGGARGVRGNQQFPLRAVMWAWVIGLVFIYLGRGVVTILHARYVMPVLPELIVLTGTGMASLLLDQRRRLLGLVSALLLLGAGIFSVVRGAQIYGDNVRYINGTDVSAALWLRDHATLGTLVATHDIGAIGYFSGHPVLDIAGLVDPEVIPLLHNQVALEAYLRQRHVAYVVIFTDWFPPPDILVRDLSGRDVFHAPVRSDFVIYRTVW